MKRTGTSLPLSLAFGCGGTQPGRIKHGQRTRTPTIEEKVVVRGVSSTIDLFSNHHPWRHVAKAGRE